MPAGHSGAKAEQFAIGIQPRRCVFTTDNTQHAVNAAPVGGLVALPTDDEHPLKAQCPRPGYGSKLALVLAGSAAEMPCGRSRSAQRRPCSANTSPARQRRHRSGRKSRGWDLDGHASQWRVPCMGNPPATWRSAGRSRSQRSGHCLFNASCARSHGHVQLRAWIAWPCSGGRSAAAGAEPT